MPITSSAKKALSASKRKRVFNLRRKTIIDKNIKAFRKSLANKNKAEAVKLLPIVYQALDKAAKTGYIKKNTASRLKSRAVAGVNRLSE